MGQEIKIIKGEQPLMVTIRCITYNHEPYIRQCLEGFVMQKTNFRFEAIVHDDASTDGTAAIIREYAEKYPDIIKPIYETENQYSKHDGSLRRIMNAHTHGKYVAMCEGDDYWIDPLKLQKQVDFLESNPKYSMCFHRVKVISENGGGEALYSHLQEKTYSAHEILKKWTVPTASVMYRRQYLLDMPVDSNFIYGDIVCFLTMASKGKLYCMRNEMAVYRRLLTGAIGSQKKSDLLYKKTIKHYLALAKHFPCVRMTSYLVIFKIMLAWLKYCIRFKFLKR